MPVSNQNNPFAADLAAARRVAMALDAVLRTLEPDQNPASDPEAEATFKPVGETMARIVREITP